MQETAFIWDLDGTLLDSYEAILSGIEETYAQFSIPFDKEKVRAFILKYSVQDLLVQVAEESQALRQFRLPKWLRCTLFYSKIQVVSRFQPRLH